jgi:transcription antitermination factor NusG
MSDIKLKQWYVVYSKSHAEEYAQLHFRLKGLECFFPRLLLPKAAQKHRRIVPLFPNYLFVRIHFLEQFQYVLWSPGVKRLVSFNGVPAALDEEVVTFIMRQANSEGIITARSNLKAGEEVRVSRGPFQGLLGLFRNHRMLEGGLRYSWSCSVAK